MYTKNDTKYFEAALLTLKSGWWELTFAKMFGKKSVGRDGNCWVTVYHWRGKSYMTDNKIVK